MRIAANLSVKDEVELVGQTIAHLRAIGVDVIVATDMGSTDGTLDILEQYRSDEDFFIARLTEQTTTEEWSLAILQHVNDADVDWFAFVDGDEYLLPAMGSLRECRGFADADIVIIDRFNIPLSPTGPLIPNRLVPSRFAELALIVEPIPQFRSVLEANPDTPWIRGVPMPKVMARPAVIAAVNDGAHSIVPVDGALLRYVTSQDLLIAHLPFSTRVRFARKIENIRRVFELHDEYMGENLGWHWRRWLASADQGRLNEEFNRNVFGTEMVSALRASGVIRSAADVFQSRKSRNCEVI